MLKVANIPSLVLLEMPFHCVGIGAEYVLLEMSDVIKRGRLEVRKKNLFVSVSTNIMSGGESSKGIRGCRHAWLSADVRTWSVVALVSACLAACHMLGWHGHMLGLHVHVRTACTC